MFNSKEIINSWRMSVRTVRSNAHRRHSTARIPLHMVDTSTTTAVSHSDRDTIKYEERRGDLIIRRRAICA
jgi:hypothetical protein